MKIFTTLLTIILLIPPFINISGQCADNFPASFYEAAKNAPIIIEGRVLPGTAKKFGKEFHEIYGETNERYYSYVIDVHKVFKGDIEAERIEVVRHNVGVRFKKGTGFGDAIGIFLLYPYDSEEVTPHINIPKHLKFIYKSPVYCNFVNYNEGVFYAKYPTPKSIYGFESYKDIRKVIYEPLEKMTGKAYREIKKWEKKSFFGIVPNAEKKAKSSLVTPTITGFHPDTITAGTFDTLTILGSGFSES